MGHPIKQLDGLEQSLNKTFNNNLPNIPKGGREVIVKIAPWLSLVGGIIGLWSAYAIFLWVNASTATVLTGYGQQLDRIYANTGLGRSWSLFLILSLLLTLASSILNLMAFSPLRKFQKKGWNYIFYSMLLNVVYGLVVALTSFGSFGNLLGSLIGSAIGAYLLFQVRDYYTSKAKVTK